MSQQSNTTLPDYNFVPEVVSPDLPPEVLIADVSLRDGEQQMEAAYTLRDKIEVSHALARAGVRRVQVGFVDADADTVRALKREGLPIEYELYNTMASSQWRENIDRTLEAGADVVHFFIRSKDEVLAAMGLSRDFVAQRVADCIEYAKSQGAPHIAFGSTHFTQSRLDFIERIYRIADESGADEMVINDSFGLLKPAAMAFLVRAVRGYVDTPVGVHCHDDFGLAVADSLAAVEAGATRVDVCVNGLGERAGNAALEEVVLACERLLGVKTGVELSQLTPLSRTVSELLRIPVASSKSVVGVNAFAQKLDIHVAVAKDSPDLFEPYAPEVVGGERVIRLGKSSGRSAVRHRLAELGLTADIGDDGYVDEIVAWVNRYAEQEKSYVTDDVLVRHLERNGAA